MTERRIVHLSDLHFGRIDESTLPPLRDAIERARADLILVSGDLTQRARPREFEAAKAFLERLPAPALATPGNHDIPLWNAWERVLHPLRRYRRHFSTQPEPVHVDETLAVVGINTARSNVVKAGRINLAQMERVRARLAHLPESRTKIVLSHHPLADGLDRAPREHILRGFAEAGVDLLLAGHHHRADADVAQVRPHPGERSFVVAAASTATSSRTRREENGFNVISVVRGRIRVQRWRFGGTHFHAVDDGLRFVRGEDGWRAAGADG